MIIVSQDKDVIVNFDKVENIWINNPLENNKRKFQIRAESYSRNMVIGEYKTQERAMQVLGEIIEFYEDTRQKMMLKNIYVLDADAADFVYYMPKE